MSNDWAPPLWMQTAEYDAADDRAIIARVAGGVEHVTEGLDVTVAGTTATIQPGEAFIAGDDTPGQGFYLVRLLNPIDLTVPAPATGRVDLIVLHVHDVTAGGSPSTDPIGVDVVSSTTGTPTAPDSSIALAVIDDTGTVIDARPLHGGRVIVSTSPPDVHQGVVGDLLAIVP